MAKKKPTEQEILQARRKELLAYRKEKNYSPPPSWSNYPGRGAFMAMLDTIQDLTKSLSVIASIIFAASFSFIGIFQLNGAGQKLELVIYIWLFLGLVFVMQLVAFWIITGLRANDAYKKEMLETVGVDNVDERMNLLELLDINHKLSSVTLTTLVYGLQTAFLIVAVIMFVIFIGQNLPADLIKALNAPSPVRY